MRRPPLTCSLFGWTFAPTILLIIIFGLTLNTISAVDRPHPRHKVDNTHRNAKG
jgi:hypothetical protein